MSWTLAIIQAIAITGISAIISFLIAKKQKGIEFQYDYRRYILDKRKAAYDKIETFINFLSSIPAPKRDPKLILSDLVKAITIIDHLLDENRIWLSSNLEAKMIHIKEQIKFMLPNSSKEEEWSNTADVMIYNKHVRKIVSLYFNDITSLDDIKAFIQDRDEYHRHEIDRP